MIQKYEAHLRNEKCMAPRSVRDYMSVAKELAGMFDVLNGLTYKQINDAVAAMKARLNWSQGTVYKYSICVKHFFKWLQREGYRQDNPYPFSEWRKPRPTSPAFLTQGQFDFMIDDPFLSHQEMTLLWILWDSGARVGEIEKMKQSNIDLVKKIVNIPYEISKGNYSYRNIPISDKCTDMLLTQFAYLQRRGHKESLFVNADNEPMTKSGLQKIVSAIGMRKSPLRPVMRLSCHQFRHSFGIRMIEKQVPQVIVQKWLGHQTLQMTSHYVNMCPDSSRRIYETYNHQK